MDAEQPGKGQKRVKKKEAPPPEKGRKYEEPLRVDMEFDEFVERVMRVKPGEEDKQRGEV